jgi:hypothetical protein
MVNKKKTQTSTIKITKKKIKNKKKTFLDKQPDKKKTIE